MRLGVGGMAGNAGGAAHRRRTAPRTRSKSSLRELEGYEDLHASAAMRRDILRNLAPVVIAEAQQCAA